MDADPADVLVADLDLPRVDRRTDLEFDVARGVGEGKRAAERACGGVERRQDPVARGLHDLATEAIGLPAGNLVVPIQQPTLPLVSDRGRPLVDRTMSVNWIVASTRSASWAACHDRITSPVPAKLSTYLLGGTRSAGR
jgi:hypothetical protein